MLNEEQIKGKWHVIKGGIKNLWGKLTDDELDQNPGSFTHVSGMVEQRYGESKDSIRQKWERLLDSYDNETDRSKQNTSASSYQRNPTAEMEDGNVDAGFDESNFSLGRDYGGDRNFNSSSAVMGMNDYSDEYDSEEIFDEDEEENDSFQTRSRGNLTDMNAEDKVARH